MKLHEYLEKSAEDLLEKFKLSISINSWETKLLKDLLMLRDAEILSKCHMDLNGGDISDTLPPREDPITLIDNRLKDDF